MKFRKISGSFIHENKECDTNFKRRRMPYKEAMGVEMAVYKKGYLLLYENNR